ncbi:alpha-xylosidase [Faecalicatena sp. AGMB00832]|uniref:Alpha-xylosidase n=1 Tax=Faecalicatena faecalis TaxID=2726362 RepID=A0ABS6D9Q6_9FIRM|nr:alpha-xylosidase [Faecalicatena faecalis]MBU3878236.1 alpha-xylosidase [Faecalicatena faecalis]
MKFTEGYWEKNERANAQYAVQAFVVEEIENGMRVTAPLHRITDRAGALDVGTITTEFIAVRKDVIGVRSYHFEGYEKKEPKFDLNQDKQDVQVEVNEDEAVMTAGRMTVRVDRKDFKITYEADENVLTSCGFRNLGYMQYDRKRLTKFPEENYMAADYIPYMLTELSLAPGECVYGLGERFTAFVKNGQVVDCWNEDGGTASQIAYKNIPFYVTNKHYGVFVDHSDNVSFEVASEKVEAVGFSVKGEEIRYNIIYGDNIKDVLVHYTDLTGKPALPPAWSFGLWLSTSFTTNYDEETTSSFIQGMEDRDLPLDVFHFDCFWMKEFHWCDFEWDNRIFPDVEGMLRRYKEKGLKICVWINPYISQGTKFFREGLENGYLLKRADGRGIKQVDNWQPGMGLVDFTNPDAVKWYTAKLKTLLDMGVDCFKTDFGERIPVDVEYYDGSNPWGMHNYYTKLYNTAVFELLKKEKGEGEAVLFARSATVGGQQFPVHWGGDCSASYQSMAESLRGGLSFTLSGFSFWSHDIGGFELTASPDVYKRWLQFGLLSTHSRLHGSKSYRVPWLFDDEAVEVCRKFTKLKLRLMPYIYQMAVLSHQTGIPSMRAMIMEFEKDPAVKYLDMQYMLGDSILVAPVFSADGKVEYYLPKGTWTHLLTGEKKEGGIWYEETYDFLSLPLFVRENTLLPIGSNEETAEYDFAKDVQIQVYELVEEKEVLCQVPDRKGNVSLTVKAERKGNQIILGTSKVENMTYLLRNITEVKSVSGAQVKEITEQGIVLLPSDEKVVVEL